MIVRLSLALPLPLLTVLLTGCVEQSQTTPATRPGSSATGRIATKNLKKLNKSKDLKDVLSAIPRVDAPRMSQAWASRLVRLSLECTRRPYPYKPGHVLSGERDVVAPRTLHPAFYGCFDWHSAVHGHWAMVRVLRRFPRLPEEAGVRAVLASHLTAANLARETRTFAAPHRKLFERPYGWAWLLRLCAELHTWENPTARPWRAALRPLENLLARRTIRYLSALSVPVRAGTHHNTAFALCHVHDYAEAVGNRDLLRAIDRAARRFFAADRGCPTDYEPSGEDFISPCMAEADLMRRVLDKKEFSKWFQTFMPPWSSDRVVPLITPPKVLDPEDPKIGHLIGLDFHRAWSMEGVAAALGQTDEAELLRRVAAVHRKHGLDAMFNSGYGGSHWLATFALYLMTGVGSGG